MTQLAFSQEITVFHGHEAPEPGRLVGYGALIEHYKLAVPLPAKLSLISKKNRKYSKNGWQVFGPRYMPEETQAAQLVFALKYEGINLLFFKKLFEKISPQEVTAMVQSAYTGQYMRKIWFLYEWLMQVKLPLADLSIKNFVPLVDEELQYASPAAINSARHRVRNNLPGNVNFCPLIYKTPALQNYIARDLAKETNAVIAGLRKDVLLRTSAFLLLKDSKASFHIEGENPAQNRAMRWGKAIAQAGMRPISKEELVRLQQIVIENSRFVQMGYRTEGGFVGEHDRETGEPIPDHISARWQDVDMLMNGLLETAALVEEAAFHPVLAAAVISFGFVFIHPFADGNGRIHRYLIHHLLAKTRFTPQGIIFPVSAAILDRISEYKKVLESYSHPLLDFISWKKTPGHNVEVLNDTADYYRYFDATAQAEFLFSCVEDTIYKIIPQEIQYLQKYDKLKTWLDEKFQMPDKTISLLMRFLEQNNGKLSKRAKENEFAALTDEEVEEIERFYGEL